MGIGLRHCSLWLLPPTFQQQLKLSHTYLTTSLLSEVPPWQLPQLHHHSVTTTSRWLYPLSNHFWYIPPLPKYIKILVQSFSTPSFGATSAACCCRFSRGDIKDINKSCHLMRQHRGDTHLFRLHHSYLYQLPLSVSCSCSSPTPPVLTIISIINAAHWLAQFCSALIRNSGSALRLHCSSSVKQT